MTAARARNLPASSKRKGFAIVMALSLLSIVFLLVISLVNLVGTDLSLADARKEKVLAQAHARMGMMVAIGEIQKHLGPDTRVSTTADILDERIESGRQYESGYYTENSATSLGQAVANNQAIDLNENGQLDTVPFGQRYWTGVWKHRARRIGVTDDFRAAAPFPKNIETGKNMNASPTADTEYDTHPAIELAWLVSGNEGWLKKPAFFDGQSLSEYLEIPDGIPSKDLQRDFIVGGIYGQVENAWMDYQTAIENNLEGYEHPLIDLLDPDDEGSDTVWILRRPLLEEPISDEDEESGQWRSKLRGEPVKVKKTNILPDDPDDRLHTHGSYAYWVGDEGVKTKINIPLPVGKISGIRKEMDDISIAKKPNTGFPDLSLGQDLSTEGGFGLEFKNNSTSSKTISLAALNEDEILKGDSENNQKKVAAHYHSLSTYSKGTLVDVRTGGLKRDLSHVFAKKLDWDSDLEGESDNWLNDFQGFIYQNRAHYFKDIPMHGDAKSNDWCDTADSTPINDYKAIQAGPYWQSLASFHNLYLKLLSGDTLPSNPPEALPRITGDNYVIFDKRNGRPDNGGNPFWEYDQNVHPNDGVRINTKVNWFDNRKRPGPKSHPIQPVLVECKFSQVPRNDNGNLALAMYPSVALWNPYNTKMHVNQLFIEIPIRVSSLHSMNPKEYDRWRKWVIWTHAGYVPSSGGGPGIIQSPPPPLPGRRGPTGLSGITGPWSRLANLLPLNSLKLFEYQRPFYNFNRFFKASFDNQGRKIVDLAGVWDHSHQRSYSIGYDDFFRPNSPDDRISDYRNKFNFLFSNNPIDHTGKKNNVNERHLLLKIGTFTLEPGEKANFTVTTPNTGSSFYPKIKSKTSREFLVIPLDDSGNERINNGFVCRTELKLDGEPLSLCNIVSDVHGTHPSQFTLYRPDNNKILKYQSEQARPAKGITMYALPPYDENADLAKNLYDALPVNDLPDAIYKITKNFYFQVGDDDWMTSFDPKSHLGVTEQKGQLELAGNGFRIRYKLPGTADRIVLEQFNLRALVSSYQDGFGDNWKIETFNASKLLGENLNKLAVFKSNIQTSDRNYYIDSNSTIQGDAPVIIRPPPFADFYTFYKKSGETVWTNYRDYGYNSPPLPSTPPLSFNDAILEIPYTDEMFYSNLELGVGVKDFNPFENRIIPCIDPYRDSNSIGFFHDFDEEHGNPRDLKVETSAILYDIPKSPMLSILQLRHANLNDYSHSSSYILGNSYASTQVGRYKTWGRVRAISWQTNSNLLNPKHNSDASKDWQATYPTAQNPWYEFVRSENLNINEMLAPVRKVEAQHEHLNTTLDHSFYANLALLDGYFMSGVSHVDYAEKSFGVSNYTLKNMEEALAEDLKTGTFYQPFRNPRLMPYFRENGLSATEYGELSEDVSNDYESDFRYQTLAGDLLLDGAFNINSTSVDAWVSQLSALKKKKIPGGSYPGNETPFPRFLSTPELDDKSTWNKIRSLSDEELVNLAHCLVEQIKLRGPFLSFAEFTNRQIKGPAANLIPHKISDWKEEAQENRDSVLGLRGAMQAAIAEAKLNSSSYGSTSTGISDNPSIPEIPALRFLGPNIINEPLLASSGMGFLSSEYGLPAYALGPKNPRLVDEVLIQPQFLDHERPTIIPGDPSSFVSYTSDLGRGVKTELNLFRYWDEESGQYTENWKTRNGRQAFKGGLIEFEDAASLGEAPDNAIAVEDTSTAANKPDWLMQSDVLSPLAPVTSARSDTFVIRVMGENKALSERKTKGRAWIELTVQRTPDYVKKYLDAPHHRPHEPFEDRNFNGYWDNDPSFMEHWLDLNQNGLNWEGTETEGDARPDLPGEGIYPDGLGSDLPLNLDPEEEPPGTVISTMGINQRFGRKFKIIKFRWIKEQDV